MRRAVAEIASITGVAYLSAISSGVKAAPQAGIALSSTGISMIIPCSRSGACEATSSVILAPSEVPPTIARSSWRWSSSAIVCRANSAIE